MADNEEQIIIDVKIDVDEAAKKLVEVQKNIENLKRQRKDLAAAAKEGAMSEKDVAVALELNAKATKEYQAKLKAVSAQIQASAKDNDILGDSLHEMRARLTQLKNEYAALSKAERESAAGEALRQKVKNLNDEVKDAEASFGDFQRNVGNYQSALDKFDLDNVQGVFDALGGKIGQVGGEFTKGLKGMAASSKAFGKAMMTPPVGLVVGALSALALAVSKVSDAFKKNDTAGTQISKLYASLQPLFTAVSKAADFVARGIGKAAEALANLIARNSDAAKSAQDLVIAQDDLEQKEREYTVSAAKNEAEISELKLKAKQRDKYSADERKKYLEEATVLAEENLRAEKEIAAERLRILEERAKQEVDTSDDTTNAIAQARAALYQAEKRYNDGQRELAEQKTTLNNEIIAEEKAATDAIAEQIAERQRLSEEAASKMAELNRQLRQALIDNMQEGIDKQIALSTEQFNKEIEGLRAMQPATAAERDAINAIIIEKTKAHNAEVARIMDEDAEARFNEEYEREMRRIDRMLAAVEEGSLAEENLRITALERMRERELADAELTEDERAAIIIKYQNQTADILAEGQAKRHEVAKRELQALADEQRMLVEGTMALSGAVFGGLSDLIGEFAGENEQLAQFQKALALFQIGIDTAKAISGGVAQAMAVPFPANLAAIASTIAAVTANIVRATQLIKQSNEPKFADGGIVGGTSYSGDKVTARVNSGEMILNLQQQRRLFEIASGKGAAGIDIEAFAAATANAVSQLPPPIMDYREFQKFERNVVKINNAVKI